MQKLVITFTTGDYYAIDHIYCAEYESAEAFFFELDNKIKENWKKREEATGYIDARFVFCGIEFDLSDFYAGDYYPPNVQTLDEWFAEKLSENIWQTVGNR